MRRTLSRFAAALRTAGVRVSPAEVLDAVRALQVTGLDNRDSVRNTLALVMPKSPADKERFEQVFERFFGTTSDEGDPAADTRRLLDQLAERDPAAKLESEPSPIGELSQQLLDSSPMSLLPAVEAAAQEVGLDNIRYFTQKPVFRRKIQQQLDYDRIRSDVIQLGLEGQEDDAGRLQSHLETLLRHIEEVVDQRFMLYGDVEGKQLRQEMLRRLNLARIDRHYQKDLRVMVSEMARKLATRMAHRQRRVRTGKLNVRRTLRNNVAYEGAIVDLYWSAKRVSRPQMMVLCDLSGSVAQYALFLLMFVHSLSEVVPRLRSFAFSSSLGEVTDMFRNRSFDQAIKDAVSEHGMGSSDYARSLADFNRIALNDINRKTTVIILGDARNNYGDPEVHHLREVYLRARRVVWLNPEHKAGWGSGDSVMPAYASCCTRVNMCHSLQHLERVIEDLLLND